MQDFPHRYRVVAAGNPEGDVNVSASGLQVIATAPPAEFGGPGNRWSPESLLVAAVADCFVLSFRAVATASKLPWISLDCEVEGTLDRIERTTKFTQFEVRASLSVHAGTAEAAARRALERAEAICLVSNSLSGETHLKAEVVTVE